MDSVACCVTRTGNRDAEHAGLFPPRLACAHARFALCVGARGLPPHGHTCRRTRRIPGRARPLRGAPDASYAWREVKSGRIGSAEYIEFVLTSQTWRGIEWKHQLFVLRPANMVRRPDRRCCSCTAVAGSPNTRRARRAELPREALLFARLAESIRAPVGVLRQVPFAPMFDRREDALIAYTFDQYLQTGETDWPLLLPMVKSTVRAMDAMQAFAQERWELPINVIHGGRRLEARLDVVADRGGRQARHGRRADGDRRAEHASADGASARDVGRCVGGDPATTPRSTCRDASTDRARSSCCRSSIRTAIATV